MGIRFYLYGNEFLENDSVGYYSVDYTGYRTPGNPDYLNRLKNTFNNEHQIDLNIAKDTVVKMLVKEIPQILDENGIEQCTVVCIPRAKKFETYTEKQLYFSEAVREAVAKLGNRVVDGVDVIRRQINTKTTHLPSTTGRKYVEGGEICDMYENDGAMPYPGITRDTCHIAFEKIRDKDILIIDDIYTRNVNIDEDAVQTMYNSGARRVFFYAVAMTRRSK